VDGEALEELYLLHTPGVNAGRRSAAGHAAAPDSAHFSLRLGHHAAPATVAPHDPATARVASREQGIKTDHDLVVKRTSKSRVFMMIFDVENYPFGCAQESLSRQGERELVFELLVAVYSKHMFEGVAHGDVGTAMAKTAAAVHNDDPLRKNRMKTELDNMRLPSGLPFEEGARLLWEKVEDLEALGVPILGDLKGYDLEKLKKEMLYTYLSSNTDYQEVLKDFFRFYGDYPSIYSHCVQVYWRLKPGAADDGNRGGNRGDGGESQSGGRYHAARREFGRFADERPRQAPPAQRESFCFTDEQPRQAPTENARRATKLETGQAQREGWDPNHALRHRGYGARRVLLLPAVRSLPLRRHG
jgi:hypothetical protein